MRIPTPGNMLTDVILLNPMMRYLIRNAIASYFK